MMKGGFYYEGERINRKLETIGYNENTTITFGIFGVSGEWFDFKMEYFKKVDKTVIEDYKERQLPIAICVKRDNQYRLIDGYHRFVANKDRDIIDIIVLE